MNTALVQIQEEIAKLEERLKLLRTAETALQALEEGSTNPERVLVPIEAWAREPRAKGLAGAIRRLLTEKGPMTKADIDKALSEDEWTLGRGAVSGALQAMKVRGAVTRTKAGKWTVR